MKNWKIGGNRNLPLHRGGLVDLDAMRFRIFEWAEGESGAFDPEKVEQAFLLIDGNDPTKRSSYFLPVADVVDGELKLSTAALDLASRAIPDLEIDTTIREGVGNYIDDMIRRADEEVGVQNSDTAQTHAMAIRVSRQTILPEDELMTRLLDRAMDPDAFKGNPPFLFGVKPSTNEVDTYFTFMDNSSLKNFAVNAEAGVAFQNSHKYNELPFGRSLSGKYVGPGNGGVSRMEADFFTVRGANFNGVNTDQLILGMQTGIIKDVSIGFHGGRFICTICEKDMFDWSDWENMCPHIPGVEYEIRKGDSITRKVALAKVVDAFMSETSAVFDGANPGAAVRKAILEAEAGRVRPEIASLIESRYRVNLPGTARKWRGNPSKERTARVENDLLEMTPGATGNPPPGVVGENDGAIGSLQNIVPSSVASGENEQQLSSEATSTTPTGETTPPAATPPAADQRSVDLLDVRTPPAQIEVGEFKNQLSTFLRSAGVNPGTDPEQTIRLMAKEIRDNRPLVEDGQSYRNSLVNDTLTAGVQAFGNDFKRDVYEQTLRSAPIATVLTIKADFERQAKAILPTERSTIDGEPNLRIVGGTGERRIAAEAVSNS